MNTLFASADGLASFSGEQRAILEEAAGASVDFAGASSTQAEDVTTFCAAGGKVVAASEADITEFERAARPVLDMRADPQTAGFIDEIGEKKDGATAAVAPTSCDPT